MENKIDEELRQYKLYKIQFTESKILEYKEVYDSIKENIIIKVAKNSTTFISRLIIMPLLVVTFLLALVLFFPEQLLGFFDLQEFQSEDKVALVQGLPFIGLIFLGISIVLLIISRLLNANNKKRNTIYKMSELLDDIIPFMENTTLEEKRKYEAFVDHLSEQKLMKDKE